MRLFKLLTWEAFVKKSIAAFAALLLVFFAFVILLNPYGSLPGHASLPFVAMDSNQRFMYPGIIRTGKFDSVVLGTSTSQLLDPAQLGARLPGQFANLAMSAGTAWEQFRLGLLFVRTVGRPRTLLLAADDMWCKTDADKHRFSQWNFPEWLYDESRLNDLIYLLNRKAMEISAAKLRYHLGWHEPRYAANGYRALTLPESHYDVAKASAKIWRGVARSDRSPRSSYRPSPGERNLLLFPALDWMESLLRTVPSSTRKLVVFMPAHIAGQPKPGSRNEVIQNECKKRVAEIGIATGSYVVDFNFESPVTRVDSNYWDRQHYRLAIAGRIINGIVNAITASHHQSDGIWRLLAKPRRE